MERSNAIVAYAALISASLFLGFWVGQRATTRSESFSSPKPSISNSKDESDSDTEPTDGDISSLRVGAGEDCKLVFVVRTDLGMTSGKMAAQCSHAALACYKILQSRNPEMLRQWERTGQTKVTLQCGSEDELLVMQAQAQSLNLCARSIQDAGRTQIAAGSRTVLGIAGPSRLVNQITGRLRLL